MGISLDYYEEGDMKQMEIDRNTVGWFWSAEHDGRHRDGGPYLSKERAVQAGLAGHPAGAATITITASRPKGFGFRGLFDLKDLLDMTAQSRNWDSDRLHRFQLWPGLGSDIPAENADIIDKQVNRLLGELVIEHGLWTWSGYWEPAHETYAVPVRRETRTETVQKTEAVAGEPVRTA